MSLWSTSTYLTYCIKFTPTTKLLDLSNILTAAWSNTKFQNVFLLGSVTSNVALLSGDNFDLWPKHVAVYYSKYKQRKTRWKKQFVFALLLISTEFIVVWNIILSRLSAQIDGITVDHQCTFGRNRSTADHIMSVAQIREKKWYVSYL